MALPFQSELAIEGVRLLGETVFVAIVRLVGSARLFVACLG